MGWWLGDVRWCEPGVKARSQRAERAEVQPTQTSPRSGSSGSVVMNRFARATRTRWGIMVGRGRVELPTPAFSVRVSFGAVWWTARHKALWRSGLRS